MDPNATLEELRSLAAEARQLAEIPAHRRTLDTERQAASVAAQLAEAFANLDGWIMGGGFLPQAWELARHD